MNAQKVLTTISAFLLHFAIGSVYAWSVLANVIAQGTGFSIFQVTVVFSVTIFCLGMTASFLGNRFQRVRRTYLCIATLILFLGGTLLSSLAIASANYPLLILGYGFMVGIGTGIGYLLPIPILMTWYDQYKALATGLTITGFGCASLLAAYLYHYLILSVEIDYVLAYAGILFSLLIVPSIFFLKAKPENSDALVTEEKILFGDILRKKDFRLIWLLFFFNIAIGVSVLSSLASMTLELYNVPVYEAVALVGTAGIVNGFARLCWSGLSEFVGCTIAVAILISFEFVSIVSMLYFYSYSVYKLCILVIIACYGGLFALMPTYIADVFQVKNVRQILGTMLSAWGIAGLISPTVATVIHEVTGSYGDAFYAMALLCCVNLGLVIILTQRNITK